MEECNELPVSGTDSNGNIYVNCVITDVRWSLAQEGIVRG
jgi:hypothetical protein